MAAPPPQQQAPPPRQPWYTTVRSHLSSSPPSSTWSASNERFLLEPYTYLASRPGKEIRSKLIDAFNHWLRVPDAALARVRTVVNMLHTASLLMDDIEDSSELRRGIPVAHKVYGTPQTLNTANYVYFLVFKEIQGMAGGEDQPPSSSASTAASSSSSPTPAARAAAAAASEHLLVEEMINLHRGQGLDLLWRDTLSCPTEEEYVEMVRNKTGGLLRIAGGLMMIWSPVYQAGVPSQSAASASASGEGGGGGEGDSANTSPPDLLPLLDLIGLLFQIRDDYMNLSADSYAQNKGFAEDLTEGKFSFPMIHGVRWSEGNGGERNELPSAGDAGTHSHPQSQTQTQAQTQGRSTPLPVPTSLPASTEAPAPHPPHTPNRQLLSILSTKPTDPHIKRYAISYLRDVSRSFAYCRKVMRSLDRDIWEEVRRVEEGFGRVYAARGMDVSEGEGRNEQLRRILEALRGGWYDETEEDDDSAGKMRTDGAAGTAE